MPKTHDDEDDGKELNKEKSNEASRPVNISKKKEVDMETASGKFTKIARTRGLKWQLKANMSIVLNPSRLSVLNPTRLSVLNPSRFSVLNPYRFSVLNPYRLSVLN
ncbi:hypothetical protein M8J77_017888 [Diaphorina citri]|nr:hypothetical protein M8J77_017888 [Diaphorina citri]